MAKTKTGEQVSKLKKLKFYFIASLSLPFNSFLHYVEIVASVIMKRRRGSFPHKTHTIRLCRINYVCVSVGLYDGLEKSGDTEPPSLSNLP